MFRKHFLFLNKTGPKHTMILKIAAHRDFRGWLSASKHTNNVRLRRSDGSQPICPGGHGGADFVGVLVPIIDPAQAWLGVTDGKLSDGVLYFELRQPGAEGPAQVVELARGNAHARHHVRHGGVQSALSAE